MLGRGPAGKRARRVMILERPARPAGAGRVGPTGQRLRDDSRRQLLGIEEVEAIGAVEPRAACGEQLHLALGIVAAHLGDGELVAIGVDQRAHPLDKAGDVGMRLVVDFQLEIERPRARLAGVGRGRIVAQLRIVHREIDRVHAKAVDAAIKPEAQHVQQGCLHRRVVHVELRLLLQEIVHVILAAPRVPGPGRAAEDRLPVARRAAVGLGIGPDIPGGLVGVGARAAVDEPGVLVRTVREDLVDQHLEAESVRARDQRVEILERAEDRIDPAIIGHVIAEILHRRREEGREPDRIDAEIRDMVELRGNPRQIADAIAVRIGKAARIDLIDACALPPGAGDTGAIVDIGPGIADRLGHIFGSQSIGVARQTA